MSRIIGPLVVLLAAVLTARPALAQVDLSGEWSNVRHEDVTHRTSVEIGDYTGLPINEAARFKAESWDEAVLATHERQCIPHVVTYAAKWDTGSVYDRGTVPRVLGEPRLVARLATLARQVWAAVDGAGYGRIDVRMDERGRTWVIDVNPNPDLSPGAGLARQASTAGWSYPELVARIVEAAFATQSPLSRARGARRAEVPA